MSVGEPHFLWRLEERILLAFLSSGGCRLSLQLHCSYLSLPLYAVSSSLAMSSLLSLLRTLVFGVRVHRTNPGWSHFEILTSFHLQGFFFQISSHSQVLGGHIFMSYHSIHYNTQLARLQDITRGHHMCDGRWQLRGERLTSGKGKPSSLASWETQSLWQMSRMREWAKVSCVHGCL